MTPKSTWLDWSPERLVLAEAQLGAVLGACAVHGLLDVRPRSEHVKMIATINNPEMIVIDDMVKILLSETIPTGILDPSNIASEIPWASLLRRTRGHADEGSNIARVWHLHLHRLAWADVPVSISMAVSAYFVSGFEDLRGRTSSSQRWARIADAHVEHEPPPGLTSIVVVRAAKLWTGCE